MKNVKKCIIPAAWFWTRFLPATKAMPKEMLPIVDKPVIQYLVEEAVESWCEEIIFITWRHKRAIEDHFDVSYELERVLEENNKINYLETVRSINKMANIYYVRQPMPRWDWDAILRAKSFINDEPFLVLFWDDIVDNEIQASKQLIDLYYRKWRPVIAVNNIAENEVSSYWIIESSYSEWKTHMVNKFLEKPNPKNTTSRLWVIWKYVLTPDVFDYLEKLSKSTKNNWELRLADAFVSMLWDKDIYAKEVEWIRFDTWSKIWFLKATLHFAMKDNELNKELLSFIKLFNKWK